MALEVTQCCFCGRIVQTRGHHVVPRSKGGREIVPTCHSCEDFIHRTWTHKELRDTFNSVERIQRDDRYQRFLAWLMKQDEARVHRTKRARTRSADRYKQIPGGNRPETNWACLEKVDTNFRRHRCPFLS